MKIKIFSAYYGKNNNIIENNIIKPIQGGALLFDNELIDLKDSIFPEISMKNDIYNEFSVLYAVWKYYSNNLDYVGFCHYRRYFVLKRYKYFYEFMKLILRRVKCYNYFIEASSIKFVKILSSIDGIIVKRKKLEKSLRDHYVENHRVEDYMIFEKIIDRDFKFLGNTLDKISNIKEGYFLNMFILKKEIFEEYCNNIFKFLEILEEEVEIALEDDYQKRVLGFLGERFTGLYFKYLKDNSKKFYEYPIIRI